MSQPRISALCDEGVFKPNEAGELLRAESIRAGFEWLRARLGEGKSAVGNEKLAILQLERRMRQIQVDKEEGKLVPADAVKGAWANIVLLVRQKLLKVANKVSPRLVFAKSESEIEKEIHGEIEEALRDLSRTPAIEGSEVQTTLPV